MREATTVASWAAAIADTLATRGIDPEAAFVAAGLEHALIFESDARFPVTGMTRLWQEARRSTGDEAVGLDVASRMQPEALHALGPATLASDSLLDALERIARHSRLVSDAARVVIWQREAAIDIAFVAAPEVPIAHEALDAFGAAMVQMARRLCGRDAAAPLRVALTRPQPRHPEPFRRFFGCPIAFGQPQVALRMDAALARQRLPAANRRLAEAQDALIADHLARFDRGDLLLALRCALIRHLPVGEPRLADVARAVGLSPRTLQRRLAARELDFATLLDGTRRELAERYLTHSQATLTGITYRLGFSDPANFTRAFRRWHAMPPSAWRAQQR